MKAFEYAEALHGALEGKNAKDAHKIFERFVEVVRARGHAGLLRLIPRELDKIALRRESQNEVVLVTADKKSHTKWSHAYDHYRREGVIPDVKGERHEIDPTIVGGFKIRTKNLLIDGSYHRALIELYRNIITKN
ncbi:MAG: F0F1 ATP synthase subunit delta [Patescibacteria group bacterium]